MKNILVIVTLIVFSISSLNAQLPVSHSPENKKVVLEEFTGIHCPYCPDGHRLAQQLKDQHPDDVFLINVHTGYYANPSSGEPDFRTAFGTALANQSGLDGYPSGTVNRHVFSGSNTALNRGLWASKANIILGQSSYCNIAVESDVNFQTREMTINVEVYYTSNGSAENYINLALLQDNVEGPQAGGQNYNPNQILPNGRYNHKHMLRHMITGQWGDVISTTTSGTLVQRQYTYILPADINGVPLNLGDIKVVGFITEGHQEIITGTEGLLTYSNLTLNDELKVLSIESKDEICSANDLDAKVKIQNYGNNTINSLTLNYNMNGETNQSISYNTPIPALGVVEIEIPDFSFNIQSNNTFNVEAIIDGITDEDLSNNSMNKNVLKTTNIGNGNDYIVTMVQDRYGSEIQWVITDNDENLITYGGPYQDLSSNTTQTHTHNISMPSNGCYKFIVLDSSGDGINGGYGAGHYDLKEATTGNVVLSGDGHFGSRIDHLFEIQNNTNLITESEFAGISIYPNPAYGIFYISKAVGMNVSIIDSTGKMIKQIKINSNDKPILLKNFAEGIYFIKISGKQKSITKKIILRK